MKEYQDELKKELELKDNRSGAWEDHHRQRDKVYKELKRERN